MTPEETQYSQQDKLEVLLGPAQLSSGTSITSVEPGYNKETLCLLIRFVYFKLQLN